MPAWKSSPVMERSDMNTFSQSLQMLLGLGVEPKQLTFLQVSVRGVIVFIAALIMVRLSTKRSLAERTAFDAVLVVVIGSMLARVINGSEAFFPTLGTGFVLVLLHRLFGLAAYYSHTFGILVKGQPAMLVQNGRIQRKNMFWNHISNHDLEERYAPRSENRRSVKNTSCPARTQRRHQLHQSRIDLREKRYV
jgi:hypothetical protein